MKKRFLVLSALISTVFVVAGCTNNKVFKPYTFFDEVETEEIYTAAPARRREKYNDYVARGLETSETYGVPLVNLGSYYDVMTNNAGKALIPSTGEQKLLVIPVEFSDYKIDKEDVSSYISNLQKAFFGINKDNTFVSVSEYYNYSSYGKLKLSGKVCEHIYEYPISVTRLTTESQNGVDIRNQIVDFYDDIISFYSYYYDDIDEFRIHKGERRNYDIPIYLVYNFPTDTLAGKNSIFWNFTFQDKLISWSSYYTLNVMNKRPDAHTLIHEVGHLLGLVDYYPNLNNTEVASVVEPVGCIDMMDSSIGDHTAFSKMALNWTRPIHVTGETEITLSPLATSGDVILLNDNWNGNVFDEYYLLEFFAPSGLNTFDVVYGNDKAKLPIMPGVKLYHVDATLGYYEKDLASLLRGEYKLVGECAVGGYDPNTTKVDFIRDNTSYKKTIGEVESSNYLYELIYNHYNNAVPGNASDEHLFHPGDSFDDFTFRGNRVANYKFTIVSMDYRNVTIKFETSY